MAKHSHNELPENCGREVHQASPNQLEVYGPEFATLIIWWYQWYLQFSLDLPGEVPTFSLISLVCSCCNSSSMNSREEPGDHPHIRLKGPPYPTMLAFRFGVAPPLRIYLGCPWARDRNHHTACRRRSTQAMEIPGFPWKPDMEPDGSSKSRSNFKKPKNN